MIRNICGVVRWRDAQQSRGTANDLSVDSSTHRVVHNHLQLQFYGIKHCLSVSAGSVQMWYTDRSAAIKDICDMKCAPSMFGMLPFSPVVFLFQYWSHPLSLRLRQYSLNSICQILDD